MTQGENDGTIGNSSPQPISETVPWKNIWALDEHFAELPDTRT